MPLPDLHQLFRLLRQVTAREHAPVQLRRHTIDSPALGRKVLVDIYHPGRSDQRDLPLLCFHDGQDLQGMDLPERLARWWQEGVFPPFILVGIHANRRRIREYGTAGQADYAGRGDLAPQHEAFVQTELLPYLHDHFPVTTDPNERAIAGFSLGGLAAFDFAWRNPRLFGTAGVFSGSLWWRSEEFDEEDPDANRIVHALVAAQESRAGMRFWFQAGTEDENSDRNNNGIIDAIDDTLDLIRELEAKGYRQGRDIHYLEVIGGRHEPATWSKALPDFLRFFFSPTLSE